MTKKILIIDDDKEILFAMSAICKYKNWIPLTALKVSQGIEEYNKNKPDIIIIDYHLPVLSGIEGVKKFRDMDKNIPIIVLTIEENQRVADKFMEAGASDFALKPIKAPDMIARINVHMKLKESLEDSTRYEDYSKGISHDTLEIIRKSMSKNDEFLSISAIANLSGLAYQTVHRYLQHMENEGSVEVSFKYGKIGRPKKSYKIK